MNLELSFGAPLVTSLFAAAEIRSECLVGDLAMRSEKTHLKQLEPRYIHVRTRTHARTACSSNYNYTRYIFL